MRKLSTMNDGGEGDWSEVEDETDGGDCSTGVCVNVAIRCWWKRKQSCVIPIIPLISAKL